MVEKNKSEEEFLFNENPEIGVGQYTGWVQKITTAFPAFSSRNYNLYFIGQLISLTGTWLQIVSQGWLVLKITNSAFQIGLIAALGTVPTLLFTLLGGVIVDLFPKRKILLFTQVTAMLLAFLLGTLTLLNVVTVWQIGIIAFCLGTVNSIDAPARQAFVSEMVNKEQLSSAIGLNSGVFNAARVIGPGMAGILIALVGIGGAFILNALSYIAVIAALLSMKTTPFIGSKKQHPLKAIKEGLSYSFSHPIISTLIFLAGVTSIFGWSYTTVLPLIAQNKFHMGAEGLGYLYAASGLGSMVAAVTVAVLSKKYSPVLFIIGGNLLFSISMILFTLTNNLLLALPLLFISGFGILAQAATINTTVQSLVKSEFRGRVMSIYILMFIGLTPLGNLQIGFVSELAGTGFAIRVGALIVLLFGCLIFFYRNKIRSNYEGYKKSIS